MVEAAVAASAKTASIALATYNGARYLQPLLDSLGAQQRLPDEMVVADDASTDDTVSIVEQFAKNAPFPVRIIRQSGNVGVLENFYTAFRATAGDIIFYCDQDDFWEPGKIAAMIAFFDNPDVHLATHRSRVVDEELSGDELIPKNRKYGRLDFPLNSMGIHAYGHQMAFDRETLRVMELLRSATGAVAPSMSNHFDIYIPFCASLLGGVYLSAEPLVQFRRHAGSTSPLAKEAAANDTTIEQLATSAERDAEQLSQRTALLEAASELLASLAPRFRELRECYDRQLRISRSIAGARCGALPARLARFLQAGIEIAVPRRHFRNRRLLREAAMSVACLLGPRADGVERSTG